MKVLTKEEELYPYWHIEREPEALENGWRTEDLDELPDKLVEEYLVTTKHLEELIKKITKALEKS